MNRACPFCKRVFSTKNPQKVYCCRTCKDRHRRTRRNAPIDAIPTEGCIGNAYPIQQPHLNMSMKKESLGYHGTLNEGISCSRCRYCRLSRGASGHVLCRGHYCGKHLFSIGEFGTCRDFAVPSEGFQDLSIDSL